MNKWSKIGIVGGAVLILVVLLYYFGFRETEDDYITDSWVMTYDPDDKGPYGTFMMKELLDTTGMFGNFLELDEALEETLEDNVDINDIYFFVGRTNYLAYSTVRFLLNFIKAGNTALIATEKFPDHLLDTLFADASSVYVDEVNDSTQYFKFLHADLLSKRYQFDFIFNNELSLREWYYFEKDNLIPAIGDTLIQLGANTADKVNFLKVKIGSGQLFLHSSPYSFTNISMMKRDGFQYAENVLRHMPPGRVQWDRYSLDYHSSENKKDSGGGEVRESMLQFIMNNPPLLWAFLILLIGAVLYALFKGKRMQEVVPATESKENMSLQYINSLSSLYLQEKKHNKLVKLKEKTFLNFIADHYYIHSNKPDARFINKLAIKSHIPKENIEAIFRAFDELEHAAVVSDQELIELHQKIENFYKNCR